jgi:alkanesulfonate monooxygenase SsuD/methylene tetrahydromethanopterin reductase-like flavin-dependent oxidoreductase (luciferase family)
MKLVVMIEGQEGVTWADWQRIAALTEELGFDALMRSDHYLSVAGAERDALDAWGTICALGPLTERIRLGTLVSPATFRPAAVLAKLAVTADQTSGGRVDLGMGTGWFQAEHDYFGLDLPPIEQRFDQLEQQVRDVHRYFEETGPKPEGLRLILGGSAKRRAAALAKEFAAEYNVLYQQPDDVAKIRGRLDDSVALSMMTGFAVGSDSRQVEDRQAAIKDLMGQEPSPAWLVGTPDEVVEQIKTLEQAGLDRIMLQHFAFSDDDHLRLIAEEVLPRV